MKLTGLTHLIAQLPPIASVRVQTGRTRAYGLLNAARPAVVGALHHGSGRPGLVVTAHPHGAQELAEELRFWSGAEVVSFPAIEALPYERTRLDRTVLAARQAVVDGVTDGTIGLVVTSARALLQPVPALRGSARSSTLGVGTRVSLEQLAAGWLEAGYAEVSLVEEPGDFARRGGVLDIFPAGAEHPVRVELFGDEVESLRSFDPATQRSVGPVASVRIPPIAALNDDGRLSALEQLMDVDLSGMNAEARTRWEDDLAKLEAGASLDELTLFAPYLTPEARSLVDCFPPDAPVTIDAAAETFHMLEELWDQATEMQRSMEQSGELPAGLKPALLEPRRIRSAVETHPGVDLHSGTGESPSDSDWSGLFLPAPLYAGRLRTFVDDVLGRAADRTVITSYQHERVQELLSEAGVGVQPVAELTRAPGIGVTLLPLSVAEGWTLPVANLLLLSDHEIAGRATTHRVVRKPRRAREAFFGDFSPGDYVVHLEHGIGRFEGVTRMTVDRAEREYAIVQYAGTDRLYVPTDQLERLTRYVAVSDAAPQLNRLGGGEWQRARQRARQAAADIARELIDIYAKRASRPGHAFGGDTPWQSELESSFPYPETPDQVRAIEEVKADMEAARPMDRLVCADVGYGKTEVAVRAAFKALMDGRQVAVLVPTTILAQQHFETFTERFGAFPVKIEVMSRFRTAAQQREILKRVESGEVDVVIGTHRILSKDVRFKKLGLLIIDEEQRFGVRHKEQIKRMRESIDVLTLTATPIPRTLHMGLVGIREISVIETPPEGRLPIKTHLQPFDDRLIREAVLRELDRDGQVYLVHNKVATIDAMAELVRRLVPEARVVVGHGQMDESQLEKVMLCFAHHQADVLVSSTIIENGLDIPNVNTIIVNNAHRLGLTQLYQLRGRVGRSVNQAYAYLLYPRDANLSHDAARRLEAVFEAQELGAGFNIALRDLEIRGAGNLIGAEQSGHAAAIGFDLYTRMISDAVEQLKGTPVEEPPTVTLDLPLRMFLPAEYVGNEDERLALYRRLAGITSDEELTGIRDELRDRFGALPEPVGNLLTSLAIKLLAIQARVNSLSLSQDFLIVRCEAGVLYDRVSLYRRYGTEAKISTNVLRVPRRSIGADWVQEVQDILHDMIRLRQSIQRPEAAHA